jgi:4-alpha-glucanotransferase
MLTQRSSGILLHPASLPGDYGIGDLGPQSICFIDWLADAGQGLWQVLPLGPTGYGDSPYAPFSTFAGNELLLSPELLARDGLLDEAEIAAARLPSQSHIDYGQVIPVKKALIRKAARRFIAQAGHRPEYLEFKAAKAAWLDDFVLFMDIKDEFDAKAVAAGIADSSWNMYWPLELATRDAETLTARRKAHADSLEERRAAQFLFDRQWHSVRSHANARGIRIIGDLPIFVAMDSADAWSRPDLFALDEAGKPIEVAGVPPDYFSETGQLWGNPLYDWRQHHATGFAWWIERMEAVLSLYDFVRIDHFRGLEAFWAVPAGERTAVRGTWRKAPGQELLQTIKDRLGGDIPVIAEDLGLITAEVHQLRKAFNLPGMRILQFAFDAAESGLGLNPANAFLPHNYEAATVAYTGTHDNDTMAGWLAQASDAERRFVRDYLGYDATDLVSALMREVMKSVAAFAIFPLQDVFGLGSEARMNIPSTIGGNWSWRLTPGMTTGDAAVRLRSMAALYGRSGGSV